MIESGAGSSPGARMLRAVEWVDARPRRSALVLGLISIPALLLTVQLFGDLRAGLTELLPPDAPAVKSIDTLHARLGGQSRLMVIAQSPDGDANRRFITELGERLIARKIPEAKLIQVGCQTEREWATDRALLLMPGARFEEAMGPAEAAVKKAVLKANPLYVDLEDDDGKKEDPKAGWAELETRIKAETSKEDRFPRGFFETPDGHTVLLMISLNGSETELEPSDHLLSATKEEVAAIRARYPPAMVVGYTGEVPNLVEEHAAILADLSLSSILVFVLVGAVILAYFRSVRGLIAVLFALTPGLLFTFAIGRLTVGHLNSNTAFLGSIIAGNGINYPLLYLAYYRARSRDEARPLAIAQASRQAFFGTLAAALAASAAYGGLSVSTFRGFSQFGWIGGVGMVTTWLFTFLSMPIAIALFDPPRVVETSGLQKRLLRFFSGAAAPRALALTFTVLSVLGAALGARYAEQHGLFEMNLSAMRNRTSLTVGSGSWDKTVNQVFGVWLNPVGGLVNDPVDREKLAVALNQTMVDGPDHVAERVQTIASVVPELADQEARLVRLKKLAISFKRVPPEQVPPSIKNYLDRWLAPKALTPITLEELPPVVRSPFAEVDGRTDRVVLLFPSLKINYDDARNIMRFDRKLAEVKAPPGAVVGGGFLFMAEIIELVQRETPRIVIVVALLVALVLTPLLIRRPLRIALVVGTVGAVAILAQANMLALGVQINMLSFAAVPITIGVGADYVVNLIGAMDAFKVDARRACARMGGAIFLCSATTIIGYASLLLAESGALRTFGWAAVFGEIMAVSAVLLVLPVAMAPAQERTVDVPADTARSKG